MNEGWNAEPNVPSPEIVCDGDVLRLEFTANGFQFPDFNEHERVSLIFRGATRYRLGPTNDEGWLRGQCRFSRHAPEWGEFYEVQGDLMLDQAPDDWQVISGAPSDGANHYLFYLRDETFECSADSWQFVRARRDQTELRLEQ